MSNFESIQLERHGQVALVTLNRPTALNAFNASLRSELLQAVRQVNADDDIRAVVLTGAGKGFGAGADLTESTMTDPNWRVEDQLNHEYKPVMLEIINAPKPWISAVNGPAAGVASALAMVCDLTVMADNAYIYQAFTAISLVPDGGATWHLVHTLGRKRAYEIIATGEKVSAAKCLDWGLCNRVVAADTLVTETLAWAAELAGRAPLSLRYAKQLVNEAMGLDLDRTISREAVLQHTCLNSEDAKEGVSAFLEKRPASWKGR